MIAFLLQELLYKFLPIFFENWKKEAIQFFESDVLYLDRRIKINKIECAIPYEQCSDGTSKIEYGNKVLFLNVDVAQSGSAPAHEPEVVGSNPTVPTFHA